MKYKLYNNTEKAWGGMFEAIKNAESSIYWESYILSNDTSPYMDFFSVLKEKAKKGIKIRLVLDGFGALWFDNIDKKEIEDLRSLGAEILFFNSWFHRIHRKILIVDEKHAFIGGVNLANRYRKWLDLHAYIGDRRAVKNLLRTFANSYFYSGGKNTYLLSLKENSPLRKTQMWLLEHFPNTGRLLLKKYYTEKIAMAEKSIIIITPYFAPRAWLIKSLIMASQRNVNVSVLMPKESDIGIVNWANYLFAKTLSEYGIKFYLIGEMNHAKALLIDQKEGMIGSNNLDSQSFDFNIEVSLTFKNKNMVEDLKIITEEWMRDALVFDGKDFQTPFYLKPIEFVIKKIAQSFF